MKAILQIRGQDPQGAGYYGAPRGTKTHRGIDYACLPGTAICCHIYGTVTKLGKPYRDNPDTPDINEYERYDYVEVTAPNGDRHRYFYIDPSVEVGQAVSQGAILGRTQKLHYRKITQHCHYEVIKDGKYVNPDS